MRMVENRRFLGAPYEAHQGKSTEYREMENVFVFGDWKGRLNAGLPAGQVQAIVLAFNDYTEKMSARQLGLSPVSVQKRLERAKFNLSEKGKPPIRTTRALCLEAMKRGIISPLILALCAVMVSHTAQPMNPVRRPPLERRLAQFRVMRKVDEALVIG